MNNLTNPELRLAALILGFYSALVQYVLLGEFMTYWSDATWITGMVLFCWIFLSGAGSFAAARLGSISHRLIFPGFLLLSVTPLVASLTIRGLQSLPDGNVMVITLLSLLPVCLPNGIIFSFIAQAGSLPGNISRNYAFETTGTVMAGAMILFLASTRLNTWYFLSVLSLALNLITFLILFRTTAKNTWNRVISVITFSVVLLFVSFSFTRAGTIFPEQASSAVLNRPVAPGRLDYILIALLLVFMLLFFLGRLKSTGKALFVAGMACMALEITAMIPLKKLISSHLTTGIILSVFMIGMVLGYCTPLRVRWRPEKVFRSILWILTSVSVLIFLGITKIPETRLLFLPWIITCGFLFAFFTGLLFNTGVRMQTGNIGKIVTATYGADMLGASLGALLASVLVYRMEINVIFILVSGLLLFTGIFYRK